MSSMGWMSTSSSILTQSRGSARNSSFLRTRWIIATAIALTGICTGQENALKSPDKSQQSAAAKSAIQSLKAQVAAVCKSFPEKSQSEAKVKAVLALVAGFLKTSPEMVAEATQAAILAMNASKAEVGALVRGIAQIAPSQIKVIANSALVVAADAMAEIQAAAPGVEIGPGNPLGPPGGESGGTGGTGGTGGSGGFTPPINVPTATQTGFIRP